MAHTLLINFANTFNRDILPLRIMPAGMDRTGFPCLKFPGSLLKLRQDSPSKLRNPPKLRFLKSARKSRRHKLRGQPEELPRKRK